MRMTLREALKDDIVAIEAGVYRMLPHKDLSGRQIMFRDPSNINGEGYSSESLVSDLRALLAFTRVLRMCRSDSSFFFQFRALWFMVELAASENTEKSCGFVELVWLNDCSKRGPSRPSVIFALLLLLLFSNLASTNTS